MTIFDAIVVSASLLVYSLCILGVYHLLEEKVNEFPFNSFPLLMHFLRIAVSLTWPIAIVFGLASMGLLILFPAETSND